LNDAKDFFIMSPATLLAKKEYCIIHKLDYSTNLSILRYSWKKLINKVDKTTDNAEANEKGKRLTHPFKQRYDNWMKEYKKRGKKFAQRRKRRLIIKI